MLAVSNVVLINS